MKPVQAIQTILGKKNDDFIITYIFLRRAVGIIGISLPFVLALGNIFIFTEHKIQSSISAYYHTGMRDVFVGCLFSIAIFLLAYKGPQMIDSLAGTLACIFAVGVALFPTSLESVTGTPEWVGYAHYVFAAALFLTMAFFSLCLFTKTNPEEKPTDEKLKRNVVYRICGYTILAAIALIALAKLLNIDAINRLDPTYWLEAVAVVAFGISWLIKGETLFQDN